MGLSEHVVAGPGDLVAVALPPGPEWLPTIRELWESGAAILPVDHRLTGPETRAIIELARPTVVLDAAGPMINAEGEAVDQRTALCMATSGTRGKTKVAQHFRAAVEFAVHGSSALLGGHEDDPWLCCLPVAHIGGMLVLLRSVIVGSPVEILPRFDPAALNQSPHVFTSLVPTMLVRLLDEGTDVSHFRGILVGGADLDDATTARAREAGARIVTTYGLTETCGGVVYDGLPFDDTAIRFGPDDEIQVLGPTLMDGYRNDGGATAQAFTLDGWLRTGDAGGHDDEGRLRVRGRLDDLIVSGAEKIWPQEVEAAIRDHPRVIDVAIAGRDDPEWGSRVVAFVVPEPDAPPPTLEELRDFASERIARFKAPRDLVILEELPRTASGKLRRTALPSA